MSRRGGNKKLLKTKKNNDNNNECRMCRGSVCGIVTVINT